MVCGFVCGADAIASASYKNIVTTFLILVEMPGIEPGCKKRLLGSLRGVVCFICFKYKDTKQTKALYSLASFFKREARRFSSKPKGYITINPKLGYFRRSRRTANVLRSSECESKIISSKIWRNY